jgi:hypothetical protein
LGGDFLIIEEFRLTLLHDHDILYIIQEFTEKKFRRIKCKPLHPSNAKAKNVQGEGEKRISSDSRIKITFRTQLTPNSLGFAPKVRLGCKQRCSCLLTFNGGGNFWRSSKKENLDPDIFYGQSDNTLFLHF